MSPNKRKRGKTVENMAKRLKTPPTAHASLPNEAQADLSSSAADTSIFDRVVSILERAHTNVVRAVNSNMIVAYWLIGREIVEEIQGGEDRAEYGKHVIGSLSKRLQVKYGAGFSVANLKRFRQFYQVYSDHPIGSLPGSLLQTELAPRWGANSPPETSALRGGEPALRFSPNLSWSHYRALMRVNNPDARCFYESEAAECGWSKAQLERHIHSHYYERMLKSQKPQEMLQSTRQELVPREAAIETLKNPYVLEFLGLPEISSLRENQLESAIITNLQTFLLELGKGFAFVARQKRLRFDDSDLYVDLVFYNCILKCYLLIDLKIGEISHRDVGQMDGYVRMFDDLHTADDDNPTVGLILCTEKNEAVARYSVLNERKQIFASKYMLYLPTEEELANELARERRMIEDWLSREQGEQWPVAGGQKKETTNKQE